jgi:hypothetical protein
MSGLTALVLSANGHIRESGAVQPRELGKSGMTRKTYLVERYPENSFMWSFQLGSECFSQSAKLEALGIAEL